MAHCWSKCFVLWPTGLWILSQRFCIHKSYYSQTNAGSLPCYFSIQSWIFWYLLHHWACWCRWKYWDCDSNLSRWYSNHFGYLCEWFGMRLAAWDCRGLWIPRPTYSVLFLASIQHTCWLAAAHYNSHRKNSLKSQSIYSLTTGEKKGKMITCVRSNKQHQWTIFTVWLFCKLCPWNSDGLQQNDS